MRIAKLLVLSALCLFGYNAKADVPEGIWTMPEPQGLEFTEFTDDETHYILYNPATKMFFASGNGWNTMASLRTFGMELWLQGATESDAPEGSYELWDYNVNNPERQTNTGNIFTDDGNASWVDHGTQGNYSWAYEIVDGCVRFQNVALIADKPEFAGMYLGFDGTYVLTDNTANSGDHRNAYTAILRHVDPSKEGASVDFKAVTVESYEAFVEDEEAYNAYVEGAKTYIASLGLKKAIEDAEALGFDVTAATAVYTNAASTAEELSKAASTLNEIIDAKKTLKDIIDKAAEVSAPTAAAQAVFDDVNATAADLKKAAETLNSMVAARTDLKKALDEATLVEFDAAEYKAIFDNAESTVDEIKKATNDLTAALIEWGKTHATLDKPADMTSFIKNPHFDNADATTGWSGDAFGRGGTVSDGAEHYSKNYNTYQKITGLAPGVYAVGVSAFYRSGNYGGDAESHWLANDDASKYAKLYAIVGETTVETPIANVLSGVQAESQNVGDVAVTYQDEEGNDVTVYAPNTMKSGEYYMQTLHQYANKLLVLVDETGELTIGVKKTQQIGGDWSFFDDFSLTYYGTGADACQYYLDQTAGEFTEMEIEEGTVYTEAYLTAYNEAVKAEHKASNIEELSAVVASLAGGKSALEKNIELWKTYKKKVEDNFAKYCASVEYEFCISAGDLGDYYQNDIKYVGDDELPGYETVWGEHKLTNEELEAEIAYIDALCEQIDKEAKEGLKEGDDVTRFLKNADFEMCDVNTQTGEAPYWTVKKDVGNVTAGPLGQGNYDLMVNALGKMNYCFESWHSHDFDVYQEVNNVPEGVYVIEAQGFVRCENTGYQRPDDVDKANIPVHLYLNNATDVFPNVYSELAADLGHEFTQVEDWTTETQGGNLYPNSMGAAAQCFEWGMYKMQTFGLVKEGETMRIGVKGKMKTDDTENWWCIWDNFKLTFQGYNVEYVQPALDKAMASIDVSKPMGKNVYDTAKGLADKAAEAKATGDGKTMFQMLADVYDASAAIISSVQLFATLQDAIENETTGLQAAIYTSANDNAKAEAEALVGTITSGIENHDFSDDEVAGLLEQIANMKTKLAMPADWESATDQNPADFTGVIVNPDFVNPETGLSYGDGWTNPGNPGNHGDNETDQRTAQAMEFWQSKFDMYQDLQGLPKGTYIVQVDAWCRTAGNQDAMNGYQENPDSTLAFVYAVGEDSVTFAAPVVNLMKGALIEDPSCDGIVEETLTVNGEQTPYYLPNTLIGGKTYMDPEVIDANEGVYTNKVIAKVGDDGKLRIGIKKDVDPANSWVVCDSWKLFYCGANSQLTPSGDLTLVETLEAQPARIEFYSVGGSRISKPGKGIAIMKKVMSDGSVKVQKVIIK